MVLADSDDTVLIILCNVKWAFQLRGRDILVGDFGGASLVYPGCMLNITVKGKVQTNVSSLYTVGLYSNLDFWPHKHLARRCSPLSNL